jgi:tetratricopeptide (TPR) repeat protein
LLSRYLEIETVTEQRRSALLRMAELEEQPGGHPDEAQRHLEAAIDLAPNQQAALPDRERLAELLVRQRQWQRAVEALQRVGDLTAPGPGRAQVELRISAIYKDGFQDARAAVESLMRALKHDPMELTALGRLHQFAESGHVVSLELDDRLDRAIVAARHKVHEDPAAPQPYQALARLWAWRGDEDAGLLATQALAIAQGQPPAGREDSKDPSKELSVQGWERVLPETARSVALEAWRAAQEGAHKLYGPALESLGVGKAERQNLKALPPAWVHVEKLMKTLGCGEHELYAARDRDDLALAGRAFVCGAAYTEKLVSRLRFRLARKLVLFRDGLGPLERIDDDELAVFFAACVRVGEAQLPSTLRHADGAKVEERAKALGKAMARKDRKALAAIGARFADLPVPGVWRRSIYDGATRAAMVVTGDLAAAMTELNLAPLELRELTLFALSEEYQILRREMGLKA